MHEVTSYVIGISTQRMWEPERVHHAAAGTLAARTRTQALGLWPLIVLNASQGKAYFDSVF